MAHYVKKLTQCSPKALRAFFFAVLLASSAKLYSEDGCQRYLLSFRSEMDFQLPSPRPSVLDAVWSADSKFINFFMTPGMLAQFDANTGEFQFLNKLANAPTNESGEISGRILLGPSFALAFAENSIHISYIDPKSSKIHFQKVETEFPDIDKNFDIHRIFLDSSGRRLIAEGSVFGKNPKVLVYELDVKAKKSKLRTIIDQSPNTMFEDVFKNAKVDPSYRIGWYAQLNRINSTLTHFLVGGITNVESKNEPELANIGDFLRARLVSISNVDSRDFKTQQSATFQVPLRAPDEHEGYYVLKNLSPSGQFLIINYQSYDNKKYKVEFSDEVDVIDLSKHPMSRQALPPIENEVYLGVVENSDDWLVYMRQAPVNHEEFVKRPRTHAGTHLVIRDLRNSLSVIHEIPIKEEEEFAFPAALLDSYDGHFYNQPAKIKKIQSFGVTGSHCNLFKFIVSPDRRKMLVLRDDGRAGQSDCPNQDIIWAQTYDIKPLIYD